MRNEYDSSARRADSPGVLLLPRSLGITENQVGELHPVLGSLQKENAACPPELAPGGQDTVSVLSPRNSFVAVFSGALDDVSVRTDP